MLVSNKNIFSIFIIIFLFSCRLELPKKNKDKIVAIRKNNRVSLYKEIKYDKVKVEILVQDGFDEKGNKKFKQIKNVKSATMQLLDDYRLKTVNQLVELLPIVKGSMDKTLTVLEALSRKGDKSLKVLMQYLDDNRLVKSNPDFFYFYYWQDKDKTIRIPINMYICYKLFVLTQIKPPGMTYSPKGSYLSLKRNESGSYVSAPYLIKFWKEWWKENKNKF